MALIYKKPVKHIKRSDDYDDFGGAIVPKLLNKLVTKNEEPSIQDQIKTPPKFLFKATQHCIISPCVPQIGK